MNPDIPKLLKKKYIKDYRDLKKEERERKSMPEAAELHSGEEDCISFSMDLLYNNKQEKSLIILLFSRIFNLRSRV